MILKNNSSASCMDFMFSLERLFGETFFYEGSHIDFMIGRDRIIEKYSIVKNILIVGMNPSQLSPDDSALHKNTKCRKKVDSWFENSNTKFHLAYINLSDTKATKLSDIKKNIKNSWEIKKYDFCYTYEDYEIIALGEVVSDFLSSKDIDHYPMPHPSGLNRFWNDVQAGKTTVENMIKWMEGNYET